MSNTGNSSWLKACSLDWRCLSSPFRKSIQSIQPRGRHQADCSSRCISTLALHFTKHRGLATGLAIAGSSFGGVIWPIVDDQLLNHRGMSFAWTMRVNGFIAIPLAIVVTLSVRRPSNMPLTKKSPSGPSTAEQGSKTSDQGNLETQDKRKSGLAILKRPVFILFAAGASIFNLGKLAIFRGVTFHTASSVLFRSQFTKSSVFPHQ